MPAYVIIRVHPTRPEAMLEFRKKYAVLLQKHGGRRLAGGPTWEVLEGSRNQRTFVLWEFPSVEAARTLWQSPEYAELKKLRQGAGELDAWILPQTTSPV